jgi:hypothetical protein
MTLSFWDRSRRRAVTICADIVMSHLVWNKPTRYPAKSPALRRGNHDSLPGRPRNAGAAWPLRRHREG